LDRNTHNHGSLTLQRQLQQEIEMSGDGFHVHGPHDHELEHAAKHNPDGMAGQLAVATAILATVGAIFAYMGGATQANAGLYKNEAAIKKTEASNQWNYYQAKSSKQSLSELAVELAPEAKRDFYQEEVKRYKSEKADIKEAAEKLEAQAKEWDDKSAEQMHQHHRWAQATTALQIAIAMAAIALLTKRKWLEYAVFGVSAVGLGLGILAWLHI
jgi:Na+/glutamate symporter